MTGKMYESDGVMHRHLPSSGVGSYGSEGSGHLSSNPLPTLQNMTTQCMPSSECLVLGAR